MSENENAGREWYRCWCEECDWEDVIKGKEASSTLINLGHGVPSGHAKTYREPTEPPARGERCAVCDRRADGGYVDGEPCCGNVLCRIYLRGEMEDLRLACFGTPSEIAESKTTDKEQEADDGDR